MLRWEWISLLCCYLSVVISAQHKECYHMLFYLSSTSFKISWPVHCNMYLQRTDVLIHPATVGGNGGNYVQYLWSKKRSKNLVGRLRYIDICNADLQRSQSDQSQPHDRSQRMWHFSDVRCWIAIWPRWKAGDHMICFDNNYENNLAVRLKAAYDRHSSITVSEENQPFKDQMIQTDLVGFWSLTQER